MNGEIKHYYKCGGRKDRNGCQKKTLRKDELEQLVIDTTLKILNNEEKQLVTAKTENFRL